jgi:hypothetical protein
MVNCVADKNFVQKEVRNMVPHCERMFHVEQTADFSYGRDHARAVRDVPRGTTMVGRWRWQVI